MRKRSGPTMWASAVLSVALTAPTAQGAEPPAPGPSLSPDPLAESAPVVVAPQPRAPLEAPADAAVSTVSDDERTPQMRPQPAPTPPPAKAKPASGRTEAQRRDTAIVLLGVGTSAFVVSYLGTAFAGAVAWDEARAREYDSQYSGDSERFRRTRNRDLAYGVSLMVPVVGPAVGIGFSGSAARSIGLGLSSVLQAGSLLMAIAGARGLIRLRKGRKLTLSAKAGATGAEASLAVSF